MAESLESDDDEENHRLFSSLFVVPDRVSGVYLMMNAHPRPYGRVPP